jgi:hypothetical protein
MEMSKPLIRFIAAALLVVAGTGVLAQDKAENPSIKVYDAGALPPNRYTVIERIWTSTWRTPFWFPSDEDATAAAATLTDKATQLGADGVINLHCVNDTNAWGDGYYCYGLAIKLK